MIVFYIHLLSSLNAFPSSLPSLNNFMITLSFIINNVVMQTLSEYWHLVIIFLIILLAIAWYQNLMAIKKSSNKQQQADTKSEKPTPIPVMVFITFLTLAVAFSPYMMHDFFGIQDTGQQMPNPSNLTERTFTVYGMTSSGHETFIIKEVGVLPGVETVTASFTEAEVTVIYDREMIGPGNIVQVIEEAGYTVEIR